MTWTAPSPREIRELGGDLTVVCETCRVVRAPLRLLEQLCDGRWAATPIDKLIFRCEVCGARGAPHSKLPGNALVGRQRLWPPAELNTRSRALDAGAASD